MIYNSLHTDICNTMILNENIFYKKFDIQNKLLYNSFCGRERPKTCEWKNI